PLREATAKRVGPETHAVMANATRQLRESGILDRVIKPGMQAPDFTLNDQNNVAVSLIGLLATGAVVLSVFRGFW
ncbi:MAG TPA: AhpC/TSA family protein, partial [Acetobacteraceae bacterium]|nr:AhpC/TSA family protein [Acetobacteraceae bacterium]